MKIRFGSIGSLLILGVGVFAFDACMKYIRPEIKWSAAEISLPAYEPGNEIVKHLAYTLKYDEEYEQADWVAYELTAEEAQGTLLSGGSFVKDPLVSTGSARTTDYTNSGYSRGHLAPAGDMQWSKTALKESYYMSNVSPQKQDFNNGLWKELEEQVRTWAIENGAVLVVVGPVLREGLPTLKNKGIVAIPEYFYKVIIDVREPDFKGVGYVFPSRESDQPLSDFVVTIDSVEALTGIDFFPDLPDSLESKIEASKSFTGLFP